MYITQSPCVVIKTCHLCYKLLIKAPDDYDSASVTMTFNVGVTLVDFPIPITNDTTAEDVERFNISLSTTSPSSLVDLGPNSIVQITDDDRELAQHCTTLPSAPDWKGTDFVSALSIYIEEMCLLTSLSLCVIKRIYCEDIKNMERLYGNGVCSSEF